LAFDEKLKKMIRDADVFLVLLTSTSAKSAWVNQEVGYALAHEKHIWPLAIESDVSPIGMLAGLQAYSLFDWSRPFEAIDRLVSALHGYAFGSSIINDVNFDQVVTGKIERTKFIVRVFEKLLEERPSNLIIRVQAAFSSIATSGDPLYRVDDYHSDEYVGLLLEEKRLLLKMADLPNARLSLLLWPVRAYLSKHLAPRYRFLLNWMQEAIEQKNIDYLIGRYLGPNKYIISERLVIEGYKLHHTPGYEMTIVKYDSEKVQNGIRDFEVMYRKSQEEGSTKATAIAEISRLYTANTTVGDLSD
jgi:hypothetical protein